MKFLTGACGLTARPFSGANAALAIKSEIAVYKPGKGSEVRITFTGTSMASPLRLLDAQAWNEGMTAIIDETRSVVADMKAEANRSRIEEETLASPGDQRVVGRGLRLIEHTCACLAALPDS